MFNVCTDTASFVRWSKVVIANEEPNIVAPVGNEMAEIESNGHGVFDWRVPKAQ
jgi:hypothetical protein